MNNQPPRRKAMLADRFRAFVLPPLRHLVLTGTAEQRVDLERQLIALEREIRRLRTTLEDVRSFEAWNGGSNHASESAKGQTH